MIDSTVMEEARRRGGIFDGVIGQLNEDAEVVMTKMIAGGSELSTDLRATEGTESSINPCRSRGIGEINTFESRGAVRATGGSEYRRSKAFQTSGKREASHKLWRFSCCE